MIVMKAKYIRLNSSLSTFKLLYGERLGIIYLGLSYSDFLKYEGVFIRFINEDWYIDIGIRKVKVGEECMIYLGNVIDSNYKKRRNEKQLKQKQI
jgi:hypothetical protein